MLSKKELENKIGQVRRAGEENYQMNRDRYWKLQEEFKALLDYLGVEIEDVRPYKKVRKKDE